VTGAVQRGLQHVRSAVASSRLGQCRVGTSGQLVKFKIQRRVETGLVGRPQLGELRLEVADATAKPGNLKSLSVI
jgi:hypothetical protein